MAWRRVTGVDKMITTDQATEIIRLLTSMNTGQTLEVFLLGLIAGSIVVLVAIVSKR